jgi:3-hydroxyacyl-CoA dehydrogenase
MNGRIEDILDKHERILEKLVEQQIRSEELLKATIERTQNHADEIKEIKESDVDVGKILERLKLKSDIIQWVVVVILTAVISYIVPHVLPK